jgi:uncharacterized protein YkwD
MTGGRDPPAFDSIFGPRDVCCGTMRAVAILPFLASLAAAQAQYPSGNPGYPSYAWPPGYSGYGAPGYPGYGAPGYSSYRVPAAPSAPSYAANAAPASLARAIVDAHNAVRARVGDPPLVWSAQLAAVAQEWANRLIATATFAHRPDSRYGENLYSISGGAASPGQVVAAWADEGRGYDPNRNTCAGVCGHYTQIVWRATRSVGCGVATDPEREVWVCDYDPPGNVVGYRAY